MLLPTKSARKAVRLGCAKSITSLSYIYASLMSAWIRDAVSAKELKSGPPAWTNTFRKNMTAVALQLRDLKETARLARWEGNVRGYWPYEEYVKLVDIQQEMVTLLSQVRLVAL
jgi:Aromatic acid exporter family member 2